MRMGMGLLIVLSLLLSGIYMVPAADSENVGNAVALTPHAPIRIDSDADFPGIASDGDGSAGDPWVIENLEIDGTGVGYCLYIGNTTQYFEVRNCSLFDSDGVQSFPYFSDSGLILYHSNNGKLLNNSLVNNQMGGIFLDNSDYVTISNNSAHDNWMGVSLRESEHNVISFNNASNNLYHGFDVSSSSMYNSIFNNTASNNTDNGMQVMSDLNIMENNTLWNNGWWAFELQNSEFQTLKNNTMYGCGIRLSGWLVSQWNTHEINITNTINGNPVYYYKNQTAGTVPLNPGQVLLANCSNMEIKNITIENCTQGIALGFSNNNRLINITSNSSMYGIYVSYSENNTIENSIFSKNSNGVGLIDSNNNTFNNNTCSNNIYSLVISSSYNTIDNNSFNENDRDINFQSGNNNTVTNNMFTNCTGTSIITFLSWFNHIINNTFISNLDSIDVGWDGGGHKIYHNNFINIANSPSDDGATVSEWDNGYPSGGNYWSDYTGPDNNYDGIGDIPYDIDADTQDRYPLMEPWNAPLVADTMPPLVLNYTPTGPNATLDSDIQIKWNETMNWTSVEAAFSYTDGIHNYTSANGTWLHSNSTNISTFDPIDAFAYETKYFVTVNCTASDIIGNPLDQDGNGTGGYWPDDVLLWNFTTVDEAPYVVSTVPANGQVDVDPATIIKIEFSEPMNQSSVEDAFSYTNGTLTWSIANGTEHWNTDGTEFTFSPVPGLEKNQTYTAFLDGNNATDLGGRAIGHWVQWSFKTWKEPPSPHVTDTYPPEGSVNVPVNTYINLGFDMEMDITSVQGAFTYTDGIDVWDASSGIVDWFAGNSLFSFQPTEKLKFDSTYTVRLSSNATSIYGKTLDGNENGVAELNDDFVFTFTTAPEPPTVLSHFPEADQSEVPPDLQAIYINFSAPMDSVTVTNGISIYPNTGYMPAFSADQQNLTLLLNQNLMEATQYRVTIMGTARNLDGTYLDGNGDGSGGDRFTFTFMTQGGMVIERPYIVSIFPSNNATIPVEGVFISVEFSQVMNRTSVENAFLFGNASTTLNVTFQWGESGKILRIRPVDVLEFNTSYVARLDGTARATNGLTIGNLTAWHYTTEMDVVPPDMGDYLFYGLIAFLAILSIMLYMANRNLRMELKKNRVMLKRAMKRGGFTEDELKKRAPGDGKPGPEVVEDGKPDLNSPEQEEEFPEIPVKEDVQNSGE